MPGMEKLFREGEDNLAEQIRSILLCSSSGTANAVPFSPGGEGFWNE